MQIHSPRDSLFFDLEVEQQKVVEEENKSKWG